MFAFSYQTMKDGWHWLGVYYWASGSTKDWQPSLGKLINWYNQRHSLMHSLMGWTERLREAWWVMLEYLAPCNEILDQRSNPVIWSLQHKWRFMHPDESKTADVTVKRLYLLFKKLVHLSSCELCMITINYNVFSFLPWIKRFTTISPLFMPFICQKGTTKRGGCSSSKSCV